MLELTGNNDLSDADCRFSKEDIDAVVPGTIQRCAQLLRDALLTFVTAHDDWA